MLAARMGYRPIYWSIDPRDWDPSATTKDILNRVLNSPNLKPGAIILMHVNSPNEAHAFDGVISESAAEGVYRRPAQPVDAVMRIPARYERARRARFCLGSCRMRDRRAVF